MPSIPHLLSESDLEVSGMPRRLRRNSLEEFWLHVNFPCNLACAHCLFSCNPWYDGGIPDLTLVQAIDYTAQAAALGVTSFYITGGEPLMWKPFAQFLDWFFVNAEERLVILTNGTLIHDEWAARFAARRERLELRVSLECYREETNDRWRGEGAFTKAIGGIRRLNAHGIKPHITFASKSGGTVTEQDARELAHDFERHLAEEQGVEIAGLKLLGAWEKGELTGKVEDRGDASPDQRVMCGYSLAASGLGLVPCPILTDVPEAVLDAPVDAQVGKLVDLKYRYCRDCFATGST